MSSRWLRLSLGTVLTISFAVSACDRPSDITSPSSEANVAAPQFALGPIGGGIRLFPGLTPSVVSVTAKEVTVCAIDSRGGVCAVPGATLTVPANAVSGRTYFQLKLDVGPYVNVSVVASSKPCSATCVNDVGAAGFRKPLTLKVSKFGAQPVTAGGSLVLAAKPPAAGNLLNQIGADAIALRPMVTLDLGLFVSAELFVSTEYILGEK